MESTLEITTEEGTVLTYILTGRKLYLCCDSRASYELEFGATSYTQRSRDNAMKYILIDEGVTLMHTGNVGDFDTMYRHLKRKADMMGPCAIHKYVKLAKKCFPTLANPTDNMFLIVGYCSSHRRLEVHELLLDDSREITYAGSIRYGSLGDGRIPAREILDLEIAKVEGNCLRGSEARRVLDEAMCHAMYANPKCWVLIRQFEHSEEEAIVTTEEEYVPMRFQREIPFDSSNSSFLFVSNNTESALSNYFVLQLALETRYKKINAYVRLVACFALSAQEQQLSVVTLSKQLGELC